MQSLFASRA